MPTSVAMCTPSIPPEHYDALQIVADRVARRFLMMSLPRCEYADLVEEAWVGIIRGLSRYDPTKATTITTWAQHCAEGEVRHYIRDRHEMIRRPAWVQEHRSLIAAASARFTASFSREPSEAELAEATGLSLNRVQKVLKADSVRIVSSVHSVDSGDHNEEAGSPSFDDHVGTDPWGAVDRRIVLQQLLQQLRPLERRILIGVVLGGYTQEELATRLGYSVNHVSNLYVRARQRLRSLALQRNCREALLSS